MIKRAAIRSALASLVSACSEPSAPLPVPSPWARTMTIAERRAWVANCSGDDDISIFEGRDRITYRAERQVTIPRPGGGSDVRQQVWCDLDWDPHRGRLDALRVSISVPEKEDLEALVIPYVELVLSEMTDVARAAARTTPWVSFAYACTASPSPAFTITCELDESDRRRTWTFRVRGN